MYARVAVARPLRDPILTYAIPPTVGELQLGHVVLCPLGSTGETGYVVDTSLEPGFDPAKIKPLTRLLDPLPAFDARQLEFFRWIADYYLAPLGMVIHTALPSGISARVVRELHPTDEGLQALSRKEEVGSRAIVLRELVSRRGLTRKGLVRRLREELEGDEAERALEALVRAGFAAWADREVAEVKGRVRTLAFVRAPEAPVKGTRALAVLEAVERAGTLDWPTLSAAQGPAARDAANRLVAAGVLAWGEREDRDPLADAPARGAAEPPRLNADQEAALAVLCAEGAEGPHLLFGVTGAGKTEVFLGAARAVLARGKQVLVLVPEIGLTPQLVGRFRARFGDDVAVLHSGLTGADRLRQWRRIRAGEANVAIGARSALFAPFRALGLVVVDEEHDDSYKQDEGVPYHARDLAVKLGSTVRCPVVLASATPSLESWQNAAKGRYHLLRLPRRATSRPVPTIELVDLTQLPEPPEGLQRPVLAPIVEQALRDTFGRGGQAIVLYNRRGFATHVQCAACGAAYECPNCAVSMTLHKRIGRLSCHYCGLHLPYHPECPVCRSTELEEDGRGTERIEDQLAALFPGVGLSRMDADTTAVRGSHAAILDAFREGRTQLLVGTQIVAKGHDFPGVHTAVVVSADRGFRMPDFRAAERTAALVLQVAGRAGRGDVPGRVFVQTWDPGHYVLRHLADLEGFYTQELRLRATLRYPPFTRLVLLRFEGTERREVLQEAERRATDLRAEARRHPGVEVLGPAPAALPRLVGRWRVQVLVRGSEVRPLRAFLTAVASVITAPGRRGVRVSHDVDPRNLM
jgi:primosomal protein N' (replication factor Y)